MSSGTPSSITPPTLPAGTPNDAWRAAATEFIIREDGAFRREIDRLDKTSKSLEDEVPFRTVMGKTKTATEL